MSASRADILPISADVLLAVFDMPVSFHRCLVPIAGGAAAALMLSHAIWMSQTPIASHDGWLALSEDEWTQDVGLSPAEQRSARRALRAAGLIDERRCTFTRKLCVRVCHQAVWDALNAHGRRADAVESPQ
jgi:hypothetical protein